MKTHCGSVCGISVQRNDDSFDEAAMKLVARRRDFFFFFFLQNDMAFLSARWR